MRRDEKNATELELPSARDHQREVTAAEQPENFSVITRLCDERSLLPDWFEREILPRVAGGEVRLLSIGAGPGDLDFALIDRLLARGVPKVEYVAVEPAPKFAERLRAGGGARPGVSVDVIESTFEDAAPEGEFDLILCVHAIYYMKHHPEIVRRLATLLRPARGLAVLVHQASLGVSQIQNHFVRRLALPRNPGFSAEGLFDVLDAAGVPYEYAVVPTTVDVTEVLDPRSPTGAALFKFLLNVDARSVGEDVTAEFRRYVAEMAFTRGGRAMMLQPLGVFILRRPR